MITIKPQPIIILQDWLLHFSYHMKTKKQSVISENGKRSIVTTQECQTSSATSSKATQRLDWRHSCLSSNTDALRTFRYSTFCSACNSRCPLEICPTLMMDPLLNCNLSLVLPLFRPRPHVCLLATHSWLKRADSSTNRWENYSAKYTLESFSITLQPIGKKMIAWYIYFRFLLHNLPSNMTQNARRSLSTTLPKSETSLPSNSTKL